MLKSAQNVGTDTFMQKRLYAIPPSFAGSELRGNAVSGAACWDMPMRKTQCDANLSDETLHEASGAVGQG